MGNYPRDFRIKGGTFTEPLSIRTEEQIRQLLQQPFPSDRSRASDAELLRRAPLRRRGVVRVPKGRWQLPLPVKAAGNFLPGPWRAGLRALELGLEIARWQKPSQGEVEWDPTDSGFGLIAQCTDENDPYDEIRYNSSIYCGPLADPGGLPGVGHNIQPHWSGAYTRHDWSFACYQTGHADPYPYRYTVTWGTGVGGLGWYEQHDGQMGWPEDWYRESDGTFHAQDPITSGEVVLPTVVTHPGRWTFLWPTFGEVQPVPMHEVPEPPAPPPNVAPGPGTHEIKTALVVTGPIRWLFDSVTELLDVLNCLHDGLPKKLKVKPHWDASAGRWRRGTPQEIARRVYENIDQIDWQKTLTCMVMNEIEDRLIGQVGQWTKDANQLRRNIAGLAFGPALGNPIRVPIT